MILEYGIISVKLLLSQIHTVTQNIKIFFPHSLHLYIPFCSMKFEVGE